MSELTGKKNRQFENFELLAKQIVEGFIVGLHQSPFHGFSVEFAEHRLYNRGESTKDIDWKVYARTDRLYTKKYLEETNLRCHILIDTSSSMYHPLTPGQDSKYLFAAKAAASLMYLLKKQRDAFGLTLFADKVNVNSRARSNQNHFQQLLSHLQDHISPPPSAVSTSVSQALHQIAESIHKRSLVIIFSDMFENIDYPEKLFEALQHLKYNKHEVILFHTVNRSLEMELKFENRPYEFVDVETGERVKLRPSEIEKTYTEQMNAFHQSIRNSCLQYKIDYIEADINQGFNSILQAYLVKRSKMSV